MFIRGNVDYIRELKKKGFLDNFFYAPNRNTFVGRKWIMLLLATLFSEDRIITALLRDFLLFLYPITGSVVLMMRGDF
ncbi:hypothetical protein V6Z11_D08G046300 [Gossypium hirsutum]